MPEYTEGEREKLNAVYAIVTNGLKASYSRIESKVDANVVRLDQLGDMVAELARDVREATKHRRETCPWHDIDSETKRAVDSAIEKYRDEEADQRALERRRDRRQAVSTWLAPFLTAIATGVTMYLLIGGQ